MASENKRENLRQCRDKVVCPGFVHGEYCVVYHHVIIRGVTDIHSFYYGVVAFYLFSVEFISQQHNTPGNSVFNKNCNNY